MPYQAMPQFKATPLQNLEIPQPAIGGLNLKDLEFEQEVNQSPYMLNMMYRNGAFGKRFGQIVHSTYNDTIHSVISYADDIFVHSGTKIYKYSDTPIEVATGLPEEEGLFIVFAQKLYYLISSGFYSYDGTVFSDIETYVPEVLINCKPDGSYSDPIDDFNIIGSKFAIVYNGTGTDTVYKVYGDDDDIIDWTVTPIIEVDDEPTTDFTVDSTNKTITFTTAPPDGDLNVKMTFTLKSTVFADEKAKILSCKYYDTFGGANNSCLFLAGAGDSKYYYSKAYDISYFPENNFASLGNTEDDITGFGRQYNVLIIFKPREIYSLYSYIETSSTTVVEENIGLEGFKSQLVNARVGCDAPDSIQLINNQLTWFNSREGICTLVSTNVQDERNVRVISRNIERTNNFGVRGILDYDEDPLTVQSADYNNKYFLVFPESGHCFMWDYEISPYHYTASSETPPKALDWFLFDHFYVKQFLKYNKQLLYVSSHPDFNHSMVKLTADYMDLDFNNDGEPDAIHSYYMTPFLQFNAVEYLKTVKNLYVQCRGDTASLIDIYYYTDESQEPEQDAESIKIGGKIWKHFTWGSFTWSMVNWAITYRRKCSLKKIQMASFLFENNEPGRDMSITHIGLQYQIVKNVK